MRKNIDDLITEVSAINQQARNGASIAELYANLESDQQAVFWDQVAFHFSRFNGCSQNHEVAKLLTKRARDHIENLYEHTTTD